VRRNSFLPAELLDVIKKHIQEAVEDALASYYSASEEEDVMTGVLGHSLKSNIQEFEFQGQKLKWSIDFYKFRGRGGKAAEKFLGADGIFELNILNGTMFELPPIFRKSLLFQAKNDWTSDKSVYHQSIKMSNWREAAFVINYTENKIESFFLDDAISNQGAKPKKSKGMPLSNFLADHFLPCKIGDTDLEYDAKRKILVWRNMENEWISTKFIAKNRIRFNIKIPERNNFKFERSDLISNSDIHKHRMKADVQDILAVNILGNEKEIKKAKNDMLGIYHTDRHEKISDFLLDILKKRSQEINEAVQKTKERSGYL
jgi:hypothetical protein